MCRWECWFRIASISVVKRLKLLHTTTQTRSAVGRLYVVVKDSVVDFVDLRLLRCRNYIPTLDSTDKVVLLFGQTFGLPVPPNLVELLLTSIASAVNACCFAEPIYRSFDACGSCDGFDGVTESATLARLPSTLGSGRCSRFGFVLLHFLGY